MNENYNAVWDEPTEIDYRYSEVMKLGSGETKEQKFPKQVIIIQDQSRQHITRMACTRYALFHIINGQRINAVGRNIQQLEAIIAWREYLKTNPNAEEIGTSLQSALNQEKRNGNIGGYALAINHDDIKTAINNGHYIYTGYNRGRVRNNKYEFLNRFVGGHAVCIIGYDEEEKKYIGINSYGSRNGFFTVDYDLIETFFTRVVIFPTNYTNLINKYKKMRDDKTLELAIKMGITNGNDLDQPMTRWQGAIMNTRTLINLVARIEGGSFDENLDKLLK